MSLREIKILHISDTHLGKSLPSSVGGSDKISRRAEFEDIFNEIAEISKEEGCDAYVHSGDIFDSKNPPHWAEGVLYSLCEKINLPGLFVRGNHDPEEKLKSMAYALRALGVKMITGHSKEETVTTLNVKGVELAIGSLPWIGENSILSLSEEKTDEKQVYSDVVASFIKNICNRLQGYKGPKIFVGHVMFDSVFPEGSEMLLTISDTFTVPQNALLKNVDYAAIGHIHKGQKLPSAQTSARYPGSPLAMTFGDSEENKKVIIVTIKEKAQGHWELADIKERVVKSGKKMVTVKIDKESDLEKVSIPSEGSSWVKVKRGFVPENLTAWRDWLKKYPQIISIESSFKMSKKAEESLNASKKVVSGDLSSEDGIFKVYQAFKKSTGVKPRSSLNKEFKKGTSDFFSKISGF